MSKYACTPSTKKCAYCNESTELNIHQECGVKMRKKMNQKKSKINKKYTAGFINTLSKLGR